MGYEGSMDPKRVLGRPVKIDDSEVARFFEERGEKFDERHPLVSVLYQDSNPELTERRDAHEKQVLAPYLILEATPRVLDVGCGIGRWADAFKGQAARYHGVDLSTKLIEIARNRLQGETNFGFQVLRAQDCRPENIPGGGGFDLVIVAGVLIYINDRDLLEVLENVKACCAPKSRIIFREPIGLEGRLTLDSIWSEEMKQNYSAIYRSETELVEAFEKVFVADGFRWTKKDRLFPPELANRKETTQFFFVLERE